MRNIFRVAHRLPAVSARFLAPGAHQATRTRTRATLGRSWALLRSFPLEQADPDRFYTDLAEDTAELIDALGADYGVELDGARVLDVGGGPGYFTRAFARRGAGYLSCEPGELATHVRGSGMDLPFLDNSFQITYSSNVAEHVPEPWRMADEMLRVTAPGGLMVLSYTVWLGPFGGHETGLWQHYVGGEFARKRYRKIHGHEPKNIFGTSLFNVSCAEGLRWAQRSGALVLAFPRYHPWWAWWAVRIPGFREFAVSNLVVVLQKPST